MADPLSTSASIVALLQLSATVIKFLRDVKDAPDDLKRLTVEICSIKGLLLTLQDLIDSGDTGLDTVKFLDAPDGPLEQCRSALERLTKKFGSAAGLKKVLVWPFQKEEVRDILGLIERQKMLFSLALQNDHFGLSQEIKAGLAEVRNDVQDLRESQKDKERQDIIAWLSTLNFFTKQNDFLNRRQEGTGKWFLETDGFKRWVDGMERTLWCPGLPGAGKTILASIIVDYLGKSFKGENIAITYIYCSYKEQGDHTDVNIISSLLQQVVQRNPFISDEISSCYYQHIKPRTRPTLGEWSTLLQSEARHLSELFIVIDALDECSGRNAASFLAEIQKLPNMRLLVTSRHGSTLESLFEKAAHVEVRATDKDVRKYLEDRVQRESRLLRHVKADPTLKETIVNAISGKAEGMFLLAQLHMDSLATKGTRKEVRKALEALPKELDSTYEEAMRRIESQNSDDKQLAERILFWISFALRPLTLRELQHALAVEPNEPELDEENIPDEELLTSVCAGLVTIDRESNIIRLVHYTAQEYFERIRVTRFPHAQASIAATCLLYISFDEFARGICDNLKEMLARLHKYPLLEYAAKHWGDHARGGSEEEIKELALKFLEHNSKLMCSSQVSEFVRDPYFMPLRISSTGLHISASFGLVVIVEQLLSYKGVDAFPKDTDGLTPLSRAARNGHERVVQLLLSHKGVNANSKDGYGRTPLSWAAWNGHERVVQLLLSHEYINADSKDNHRHTPLLLAVQNGHDKVVQLLLSRKGVNANSRDDSGHRPLSWAAQNGHERVVQQLLSHKGVNADSGDGNSRTPLSWATQNGHERVVQLLLSHKGVNADSGDGDNRTPLSWAAQNGHERVVQLQLSCESVNADSKDNYHRTPLSWAALNGHEKVVQLLLSHKGVNADSRDNYHYTPLSWAAQNGHNRVAQLLLSHKGTDADSRDKGGCTPLSRAAREGHERLVELLLSHGVNANSEDNDGRTALSWATENGHERIVQLLTPLTLSS